MVFEFEMIFFLLGEQNKYKNLTSLLYRPFPRYLMVLHFTNRDTFSRVN